MDANLASTFADYTRETAARAGTYDLVDRTNIDAIMQEQELQASELVSQEKAVEIGKLAGAELIAKYPSAPWPFCCCARACSSG